VCDLAVLFLHLLATVARLAGPGGARSVVAESVLVKHQLTPGPVDPFRDRIQAVHAVEPSSSADTAEASPALLVEARR
jgi:hypothetical protein